MILLIDTTRGLELRIGLANGRLRTRRRTYTHPAEAQLLALIDELLRSTKATSQDLSGIVVATGPGPFSALRSAVAVANALGYVWQIPAVGVPGTRTMTQLHQRGSRKLRRAKIGQAVTPMYGKAANITTAAKR